jgi:uncharacterized damage-inducible protein DinB
MTLREFFIQMADSERPAFERVLKAVNQDKWDYQPDPKTKKGKDIAGLIASEPSFIANIIRDRKVNAGESNNPSSVQEMVDQLNKGFDDVKKAAEATSDADWENAEVSMNFPGGEWKDKLGSMAFGFMLDMIHHRGQLSTYLRAMGGTVPSIYGPSGDTQPGQS